MSDLLPQSWQSKLYPGLYPESVADQREMFPRVPGDTKPAPPRHICGGLFELDCPACAAGLE